jgi:asparagine synthase (glutamine-hydrolysing)
VPRNLIGAHRVWNGPLLPPGHQDRFVRSLGIAGPRPAERWIVADTVCASTAGHRGWRPARTADGSAVLFSGHIDNRRDIWRELGIELAGDAQLYAAALSAWGDSADLRIIGQFATIVVRPNGEEIRLSRSPISAPPLYFWHDGQRFIVATLPGPLFATGEVEQVIDEQKVADSLFLNPTDGERTWFAGVRRLGCGRRAVATPSGVSAVQYYDLAALPEIRFHDESDYVAAAASLFEDAVRCALDGFEHPAISLSGGLDSQAIAAEVARSRSGQPLQSFTGIPEADWDGVTYPSVFGNERPYVEALAGMYPEIRPHWVDAKGLFLDHKIDSVFMLAGEPPGNAANLHWIHEAYGQARAMGCDVMLEGGFGNASFSFDGEGAVASLFRQGKWLRLWREAAHLAPVHTDSRLRAIASRAIVPSAPDWVYRLLVRLGAMKANDPYETWCPLNRAYARKHGVEDRARRAGYDPYYRHPASSRNWRDSMVMDSGWGESIGLALDLMHGIETRDPTAYRPLVEFCLGIPDDQYLRNGINRRLARRMLKGKIPDEVVNETRFGTQCADWHLRLGRQRESLLAELDRMSHDKTIAPMLNIEGLRQTLDDWPQASLGASTPRLKLALGRGLTTARFVRFVQGRNN